MWYQNAVAPTVVREEIRVASVRCCRKATTVDRIVCHQPKIVDKKEQADFRAKKARSKENKKSADVARSKPTKKRAKKE